MPPDVVLEISGLIVVVVGSIVTVQYFIDFLLDIQG
jgi:hypothetical protein